MLSNLTPPINTVSLLDENNFSCSKILILYSIQHSRDGGSTWHRRFVDDFEKPQQRSVYEDGWRSDTIFKDAVEPSFFP